MAYSPATSAFPTSLDSVADPGAISDTSDFDHAGLETFQNDAIEKLQAKVGIDSSAVATSLDKRVATLETFSTTVASGSDVDAGTNNTKIVTPKAIEDSAYVKSSALPVKATGAEVDTGTDDAKFVTAKAVADSAITTASKTQTLTNKTQVARVAAYTPAGAGTTTLDLSTGGIHSVTMPAATQTLAISNGTTGQCFIVEINNVTSQGALTWFTTIKWAGGSAPSLTGTNGKKDTFGFRITGAGTYDGYIVGQNI